MEVYDWFAHDVRVKMSFGFGIGLVAAGAVLCLAALWLPEDNEAGIIIGAEPACKNEGDIGHLRMMKGDLQVCR